jgi:16S rRNA (guanine1207-N2)-methyltransferase
MSRFHHQSDAALETMLHVLGDAPELVPAEGCIAFLHARPHQGLGRFRDRLVCQQDFKPTAEMLEAAGWPLTGSDSEESAAHFEGKCPMVLLLPERQKLQTLADIAQAFDMLEDGGLLLVGLHNDWGAKRFEKHLDEVAGKLGTLSKFHCRAFWARKTKQLNQALLNEWRTQGDWQRVVEDRFWSRPGLFSWDRVDGGSQYLMNHLPEGISGRVADLGGGWGCLSDFVLRKYPLVHGLDVFEADQVALEASMRNLGEIGSKARVTFTWADVTEGIGEKKYDFIVVNPPFHEDRAPDPHLGAKFIYTAQRALKNGGELWLVANRHLPYEVVMSETFPESSTIIIQDGSYKVLRGVRRAPVVETTAAEAEVEAPMGSGLRRKRA